MERQQMNPKNLRELKFSGPYDVVTAAYQLLMLLTILFYFPVIPYAGAFIFYHIAIVIFLLYLPLLPDGSIVSWLKKWNMILIVPTNFSELHYLVHNVNPVDWDDALIQYDLDIFGVHPTVWLEAWSSPVLTEYLQIIYTSFYFIPIILAVILARRNDTDRFNFFVFTIVFGFYISYIGYFLVPAIGPRFTLDHLQSTPVTGLWLTDGIRHVLNVLENEQRDAFPSGHTEITVLSMYYAFFYSKKYFYVLLIVGTSMLIATVYLRYHYVVDVFAGIILAAVVIMVAPLLYNTVMKRVWK